MGAVPGIPRAAIMGAEQQALAQVVYLYHVVPIVFKALDHQGIANAIAVGGKPPVEIRPRGPLPSPQFPAASTVTWAVAVAVWLPWAAVRTTVTGAPTSPQSKVSMSRPSSGVPLQP